MKSLGKIIIKLAGFYFLYLLFGSIPYKIQYYTSALAGPNNDSVIVSGQILFNVFELILIYILLFRTSWLIKKWKIKWDELGSITLSERQILRVGIILIFAFGALDNIIGIAFYIQELVSGETSPKGGPIGYVYILYRIAVLLLPVFMIIHSNRIATFLTNRFKREDEYLENRV